MTSGPAIDLRSDTVTVPCAAMRRAMAEAEVGDDVYGEDPTVKRLQRELAERAGQDDGLFFPSGTQSNLVALLSHCERGDEYIVGQDAHTYMYEGGGAAVLGSIQPQPIENADDGTIPLPKIEAAIKDDDPHFARTRLLALENTTGGKVIAQDYIAAARELARKNGLAFHLDGARVFNAAVAQGCPLVDITGQFDSVSICFSKGLGTPVGTVLVGGRELIARAQRWRKVVGGGMRQVGVLAAAAQYALQHNVERLADDHARAQRLADGLAAIDGVQIVGGSAHTNMVFVQTDKADELWQHCAAKGLKFSRGSLARMVVHKDIDEAQIDRALKIVTEFFD